MTVSVMPSMDVNHGDVTVCSVFESRHLRVPSSWMDWIYVMASLYEWSR